MPSRRATHGRVGAWTTVKMTTSTKTRSKIQRHPGRTDGGRAPSRARRAPHRAARPTTGRPGCATTSRTAGSDDEHRQRAAEQQQGRPDDEGRHQHVDELVRVREQPEQHEQADLRQPPDRRGEARATAGRCGSRRLPEHEGREVAGQEAGGVQRGGRRRRRARPPRRPRSRTARMTWTPPAGAAGHRPSRWPARSRHRRPARARPGRRPATTGRRRPRSHAGGDRRHQEHDGRVVEARLGLEHAR